MKRAALVAGVSVTALICAFTVHAAAAPAATQYSSSGFGFSGSGRWCSRSGRLRRNQKSSTPSRAKLRFTKPTRPRRSPRGCCTSSSRSTSSARRSTPTARPSRRPRFPRAPPPIRRRWACSASCRRTAITFPISTTPRCPTCSASPGREPRCTKAPCPAIRRRTAASACRTNLRSFCGRPPRSARASSSPATSRAGRDRA